MSETLTCQPRCERTVPAMNTAIGDALARTVTGVPRAAMDTIFVSIAAYRDPDLVTTVEDCLAKATRPDRLRFGICWQHAPDERLPGWLDAPPFRKLDVDARDSQGVCWARAMAMSLFGDEDWYLQLDSHHRFIQGWDTRLIDQAALTESSLPLVTTYPSAFSPGREADAPEQVTQIDFHRFTKEGVILTRPRIIFDPPRTPIQARFVAAGFLFAPGRFVNDVCYDPELYFIGEEITLAVRAFSHGYDLYHPVKHILWHEYTRPHRPRHWDDHTSASGVGLSWDQRDAVSLAKISRFLANPEIDRYQLGSARTFGEYEAYAGISFRNRRVQDYTQRGQPPPNPPAAPGWAERVRDHHVEMRIDIADLRSAVFEDPTRWYVGIHDRAGREIYRCDAEGTELEELCAPGRNQVTLVRHFASEAAPVSWTVWPHSASRGWLSKVTRPIHHEPEIFVSIAAYRDLDLIPTIEDCLAKAQHPERLRFGVCWQHGPDEVLEKWLTVPQFRVRDVDWRDSRGPCWARAEAMGLYEGEDFYLQLDSHHRFVQDWDTKLTAQARLTGSPKPLLSAPAPAAGGSAHQEESLWQFQFIEFRPDGIPEFIIASVPDHLVDGSPIRTRLVSAHFIFAPGSYVEDVPCDPDLYYSNVEITLSIRAFTHGYDLFIPGQHILWHDYVGSYRRKHWDDHTPEGGVELSWHDRYARGIAKVVGFLAEPREGRYGLGTARSFADYEGYAGISVQHRRLQDYTRLHGIPPNPPAKPGWHEQVRERRVEIELDPSELPISAIKDPTFWYVAVHDHNGRELYRRDATPIELADLRANDSRSVILTRKFSSEAAPVSWTVRPHSASAGWLDPVTGVVSVDAGTVRAEDVRAYRRDLGHGQPPIGETLSNE